MPENQDFPVDDNPFGLNNDNIEIPSRGRPKKKDTGSQEMNQDQFYNEKQNAAFFYGDQNAQEFVYGNEIINNNVSEDNLLYTPNSMYQNFGKNDLNNFSRNQNQVYQRNDYNGFNIEQNNVPGNLCQNNMNYIGKEIDSNFGDLGYNHRNFFEEETYNVSNPINSDNFNTGIDPKQIFSTNLKNINDPLDIQQQQNFHNPAEEMHPPHRPIHPGGLPNDYFMHGNPWLNRKKRKSNPLLWQYMQQNKDFHPGLVHPRQYSSVDYIQGIDRTQKMFLGCVKRQHTFPDKNTPNYTVLPLFLNSTSYYENHIQNQEFEKIACVFIERTRNFDYENVTVQQLKILMKEFGLNHTGKKSELIERVKSSLSTLKRKLNDKKTSLQGKTPQFSDEENHFQDSSKKNAINIESLNSKNIKNSMPFHPGKNTRQVTDDKNKYNGEQGERFDIDPNTFGDANSCDDYLFF